MDVEHPPRRSAFLWLACAFLVLHAVQYLGIGAVIGYGAAVEQITVEFAFGGSLRLTSSYLWLILVPASLGSIAAVWREAHEPRGGPALAAAAMWMVVGILLAAGAQAAGPLVTSATQLLVAFVGFVRMRPYRIATS